LAGLTQLRKESGTESILGVGGVTYNDPRRWPELPGTKTEIAQLQQRAGMRPTVLLSGAAATAQALRASLPGARYAHLATHGQFAREQLSDEARAAVEQWRQWTIDDSRKSTIRVAERHPLAFVSLVLANGEPITGLQIIDLPLESMYLVTLSACETGLGELTGGEGVHGLQRAFHLAGCPNVVASLWKVNDAATAALMAKFYHEMWVNKKPPIEALREAQLTIYRHPELIPDLAGERGAPRLKEAVAVKRVEPRGVNRRVSDTKLWAAFVLSGLGK
jgi:CHAT domain-containing protein